MSSTWSSLAAPEDPKQYLLQKKVPSLVFFWHLNSLFSKKKLPSLVHLGREPKQRKSSCNSTHGFVCLAKKLKEKQLLDNKAC